MAEVRRFEDLIAWQKARVLAKAVYDVTRQGTFARDFGLAGQIQRAAVSAMSNIAEGYERARTAEYVHHLDIAKGSAAEVRSDLYVALDCGHLEAATFQRLQAQAEEVGRLIGGLRSSIVPYEEKRR